MKSTGVILLTIFINLVISGNINRTTEKREDLTDPTDNKDPIEAIFVPPDKSRDPTNQLNNSTEDLNLDDIFNNFNRPIVEITLKSSTSPRPTFPPPNLKNDIVFPPNASVYDNLDDIFGNSEKNPSTTSADLSPENLAKSSSNSTTKEESNYSLFDNDTLDDLFLIPDKSSTTTSTVGPSKTLITSHLKDAKEEKGSLLDKDTLDDLFLPLDESSTTSSTVSSPKISITSRFKYTKSEKGNNSFLDKDTLDDLFALDESYNDTSEAYPTTTSTVSLPKISIRSRLKDSKEEKGNDSLLDKDTLDDLFALDESSTTTSPVSLPKISITSRLKDSKEEKGNDSLLDKDTLDDLFALDESSTTTSTVSLPKITITSRFKVSKEEKGNDSLSDMDSLDDLFKTSGQSSSTNSTTPLATSPLNTTVLDKESIDLETTTKNPGAINPNLTFNYRYIDWDNDDDSTSKSQNNAGVRMNDDLDLELDLALTDPLITEEGNVILTYEVNELDPPLETIQPLVPSRINVNKTTPEEISTTTEGTTDSDEDFENATEPIEPDPSPDEIIECAYGTPKFPIPKPNVNKYAGKERRRIADIKCEEQMLHIKYNIFDVAKNELICRSRQGYSEIIGGHKSTQKQFPHMGAVGWIDTDNQPIFFCGSTLISSRFSLTAAHCRSTPESGFMNVISPYPKLVRFGNVNIKDITIINSTIDVNIEKFITLPEFDARPLKKYNDIALIRLTSEVMFSEFVRPACVWHQPMDNLVIANVTGWGLTESGKIETRSEHLRYAEINILKHEDCEEQINHRKFRHWDGLIDKQFCAGNGGKDTCQGDSGGPLQVQEPFKHDTSITVYHVVGVTSFGFDCGRPDAPGLYTKVNKYLCFIEKTVWPTTKNHLCP